MPYISSLSGRIQPHITILSYLAQVSLRDSFGIPSSSVKMAYLHQFDYIFAFGLIFAFLDAWNIGEWLCP